MLALALTPAALLACASCSSTPKGQSSTEVTEARGTGRTMVETHQATATVTAIDSATRHITLTSPDGTLTTIKAGPEVRNFDQIHVGDQVKTTMTEMLAVSLRPKGAPAPAGGETTTVTVAPKGAKPGVQKVETSEITAKITGLDTDKRMVRLQYPDGTSRTVKVRDDVDLAAVHMGDDVVMQYTESLAIHVEKP